LKSKLLDDAKNSDIDLIYFDSLRNFLMEYSEPIGYFDRDWIEKRLNLEKVKELIEESGILRTFSFYNKFDKYIELSIKMWYVKLDDFYLWKSEIGLEVNFSFAIITDDNLRVEKEKDSIICGIKIEYSAMIADNEIIYPDPKPIRMSWVQT